MLNILRMDGQNFTKFCIHIIIDKVYVAIVKRHFAQICNWVTALDWCQKLVFAQYLENGWTEFNQIFILIIIDKIYIGNVTRLFFCKYSTELRPLLDVRNWFLLSILRMDWTEFNQILYTLYHWQDLCLYCKESFFTNLQRSYRPWLMSVIVFVQYLENLTNVCIHIIIDKV